MKSLDERSERWATISCILVILTIGAGCLIYRYLSRDTAAIVGGTTGLLICLVWYVSTKAHRDAKTAIYEILRSQSAPHLVRELAANIDDRKLVFIITEMIETSLIHVDGFHRSFMTELRNLSAHKFSEVFPRVSNLTQMAYEIAIDDLEDAIDADEPDPEFIAICLKDSLAVHGRLEEGKLLPKEELDLMREYFAKVGGTGGDRIKAVQDFRAQKPEINEGEEFLPRLYDEFLQALETEFASKEEQPA